MVSCLWIDPSFMKIFHNSWRVGMKGLYIRECNCCSSWYGGDWLYSWDGNVYKSCIVWLKNWHCLRTSSKWSFKNFEAMLLIETWNEWEITSEPPVWVTDQIALAIIVFLHRHIPRRCWTLVRLVVPFRNTDGRFQPNTTKLSMIFSFSLCVQELLSLALLFCCQR